LLAIKQYNWLIQQHLYQPLDQEEHSQAAPLTVMTDE